MILKESQKNIERLCPNCGLCCDGTLFADVELRTGDDARRLKKLGLSIRKKENEDEHDDEKDLKKARQAFTQPCACFDGKFCAIYEDRPKRCRLFECGLLKKVNAGEMRPDAALKKIAKAKEAVKTVEDLLRSFGVREDMALSERYARAMSEPVDLTSGNVEKHGELMQAYAELMRVLQRDFLR
jgi:uncharacterized protein